MEKRRDGERRRERGLADLRLTLGPEGVSGASVFLLPKGFMALILGGFLLLVLPGTAGVVGVSGMTLSRLDLFIIRKVLMVFLKPMNLLPRELLLPRKSEPSSCIRSSWFRDSELETDSSDR